jgi:hypothetical protein
MNIKYYQKQFQKSHLDQRLADPRRPRRGWPRSDLAVSPWALNSRFRTGADKGG